MAFEQVKMRTADGQEYGPVSMDELRQWRVQGRVPNDATIVDAATGEAMPLASMPAMVATMPPPPVAAPGYGAPQQANSGMDQLIPAKNVPALVAYYLGVLGLAACILGPLAIISGIAAIVLGSMGLKKVPEVNVGKAHAITGIVLGIFQTLFGVGVVVFFILMASSNR